MVPICSLGCVCTGATEFAANVTKLSVMPAPEMARISIPGTGVIGATSFTRPKPESSSDGAGLAFNCLTSAASI